MIPNYGSKIAFTLFSLVLIGLSVAAVILKSSSITFIEEQSGTSFSFENVTAASAHQIWVLPENLYHTPAKFVVGTAITSIIISGLTLLYMATNISDATTSLRPSTTLLVFITLLLNAILTLSAMIVLQTTHDFSSQLNTAYSSDLAARVYDSGTFDLEAWACEVKDVPGVPGIMADELAGQCRLERAGRMVVIFWMLTAVMVAGMAGWTLRGVKKGIDGDNGGRGKKMWWREWIPLGWWTSGNVKSMPAPVPLERRPYSSQYSAAYRSDA
ncbi:hypothetical protein BU16DRAFT_135738 [Lophium mytilinum]|uniref:Uncharacterized protein n=1 Tax=Lophium mytilinum TaxID=390894 RepID=A0A6A6QFS8_9PEZI|nr:hypothetical protein BU16DRAFT_135738 [Lophium mytilinum]